MSSTTLTKQIEGLLERIAQIRPLLRENSAQNEAQAFVAEESIRAMADAGVFKTSIPTKYGGYSASTKEQIEVARAVALADGATAWITGLLNSGAYVTGLFDERAQDDVFGTDPDARVSIVLAPSSHGKREGDGYRVSGTWHYNSGSWHSDWAILGVPLHAEDGTFEDNAIVLIPREDLEYEVTWFVAGMKGTASNTFHAKDVVVPEHRVLRVSPALQGTYPGTTEETEPAYRAAFVPVLEAQLLGPHLGMARAVLEIARQHASKKSIAYTTYERQSDSVPFQLALARATLLIEAAELFADNVASVIDEATFERRPLSYGERAQLRGQQAQIVEDVKQAIDLLMTAHGSAGFAESSIMQRYWRDQAVAARHGLTLLDTGLEVYGRWLATGDEGSPATPFV